ncbi:MAG TPA: carbohydrate-binding protein [Bryobacteraceae bacterium]|jgi:glucosylceramidase
MLSQRVSPILAALCLWAASVTLASAQVVNVWLTTDDRTTLMAPQPPVSFTPGVSSQLPSIYISESQAEQTIEGFGASMTDSAAYLLKKVVPPAALGGVMQSIFGRSQGIGVSFLRNPMGASDITRPPDYSYDDVLTDSTDSSLPNFSISHDQTYILPLLLQAKAINPQIKMLGTPWSPPGWMKENGSMVGGTSANAQLLPAQYTAFANYLVKYVQAYQAYGVPVDYLTIQNEPLYVPINYPGEYMAAPDQLNILKSYVLPALAAANITTKILVYDHNWDTPTYPETVLADSALAASPQIAGVAWHWYGGPPGAMTTLHNLYPQLGQYVTEASGETSIPDEEQRDFEMIIHSMRNWSRSFVKWSLALDQNNGPHTGGCGDCTGLIMVNSITGAVTNNIDYYTLGHFSKFVLPGAVRVWSNNAPGLISAAFINPLHHADLAGVARSDARERSRVLVVYNDSASTQTFQVVWYGTSFQYSLPSYAGATFQWDAGLEYSCRQSCWTPVIPATTRIQASSYNTLSGLQTEPCADKDSNGGFDLGYSAPGLWAEYRNIDFGSGVSSVQVRVANDSGSPGTLEFHSGSPTGPLLAQAQIAPTNGWQSWTTITAPVPGASGVQNLFLVFQSGSSSGEGNVNWFQFQ